jgi:two-component system CheB/CheR fusion protein
MRTARSPWRISARELQTVNEELRERTAEAGRLNVFLESVLRGIRSAAVVVNPQLEVLVWNRRAEDFWGLRFAEVEGKSLLGLDIGLPVAELRAALRSCLSGEAEQEEVVLEAINRRGKSIKCHITVSPLLTLEKKREGAILLMDETA